MLFEKHRHKTVLFNHINIMIITRTATIKTSK